MIVSLLVQSPQEQRPCPCVVDVGERENILDNRHYRHETADGEQAVLIGEVREQPAATVLGTNEYGGTRVIDMLVGDPLPRIC